MLLVLFIPSPTVTPIHRINSTVHRTISKLLEMPAKRLSGIPIRQEMTNDKQPDQGAQGRKPEMHSAEPIEEIFMQERHR